MLVRLKRTAVSFLAVLAAFVVYRLIAEPLIEPPAGAIKRVSQVSPAQLEEAHRQQSASRLGGYSRFFPPGSWELDNPIILESDTSKILLKEYATQSDGRVKVTPCTVIYFPDGDAEAADSRRRVIVLQNPRGALLQFDGDVDLSRGKIGKLLGGRLDGPVTIQSAATKSDGSDDLFVSTHDVVMKENFILTPNEVDFRFGPSHGHGRNMRIELLPGPDNGGKTRGPSIGGLQSFELTTDVEMHLQPGSSGFMPGDRRGPDRAPMQSSMNSAVPQPPVDIRCQGPFQFDLVAYVATFHEAVDVRRANLLGGASDQMNCELLSIFFAPRDPAHAAGAKAAGDPKKSKPNSQSTLQLEPRRLEAEGNPVVVNAPSRQLEARSQRLQYDIISGRIGLQSSDEVMLHQESNEAHAKTFVYTPGPNGAMLGELDSDGPGWMSATSRDDPSQRFQARWSKKLTMLPQNQNHVISLTGSSWASYSGRGELAAEEIHVWLYEVPIEERTTLPPRPRRTSAPSSGSGNAFAWIRPVQMFADGGVHIESPQLSGLVKRMEAMFREPEASATAAQLVAGGQGPLATNKRQPPLERAPPGERAAAGAPAAHYEIKHGGLLQAWLINGQPAQLENVVLKDDVDFAQTPGAGEVQTPLEVIGDEVQVLHAPGAAITVKGHPAQIAAQGLTMFGQAIQLDRPSNRLWIDGAGRMTWTGNRASQKAGDPADAAAVNGTDGFSTDGPMDIDWRDKMMFDGRTALYEGDVVSHRVGDRLEADGRRTQLTQTVRTPALEVTLHEAVNFAEMRPQGESAARRQMEQMKCRGDVQLENRELIDGHPAALEQMQICDLVVNGMTGEMSSQGPGRLYSWRLGSPSALMPPQTPASGRAAPTSGNPLAAIPVASTTSQAKSASQINYLDVQFQNGITGNVLGRRQMTFHDQVRSLYGPVPAWDARLDPDDPHGLGPQTMLLTCDQMTVSESGLRVKGARSPMEMEAQGNTRTEGKGPTGEMFTAEAARLSYSEAKDMLILQGDGRADAQLFRQQRAGEQPQHLQTGEIRYWPSTGNVESPRSRLMSGGQLTPPRAEKPAMPPAVRAKAAGTKIAP